MELSFEVVIPANTNEVTFQMKPSLNFLDIPHEIAIKELRCNYSWLNIDASTYDNAGFRYSIDSGNTWKTCVIPDGNYNMDSIIESIHEIMYNNSDYSTVNGIDIYPINFVVNDNTNKLYVRLDTNHQIDFSTSNLYSVLGMPASIITTSQYGSDNMNVNYGISAIYVKCDQITGNMYFNGNKSNILFSCMPDVPPNSQYVKEPNNLVFVGINTDLLSELRLFITDQTGQPFYFNDIVTMTLLIKPRKILKL